MIRSTRTPPQRCPACGHALDAATNTTGTTAPTVGDVTVCVYCAEPLRFGSGLVLERDELAAATDHRVRRVVEAVRRRLVAERGRLN